MAQQSFVVFSLSLVLAAAGCSSESNSPENTSPPVNSVGANNSPAATPPAADQVATSTPASATTPAPGASAAPKPLRTAKRKRSRRGKAPQLPKVILSEQHAATCRVNVGDKMPDFPLVDTEGEPKNLKSFLGERVTVVCFWDAENPLSNWQIADLGPEVVEQFADQGVNVVAINRGQSIDDARAEADKAGVQFPVLVDEGGKAYEQVATRYLPRTYLLDSNGKVVWLDLDYSNETRRHLNQAIHYELASEPPSEGAIRR